jgi:Zn-dependent peptidase ImmA (M78 family)
MDTLRRAKFIEAKADEALRKTGQTKPPIDLGEIARHYGVPVRQGTRGDRVVAHYDNTRNEIVLGEHDRWPFAHELGHALLGHGSVRCHEGVVALDAESPQSELGDDPEAEANRFARHLLVPREMAEFLLSRGLKIPDLAKRCQVSETVVWYALDFYGLV